MQQYGLCIYPYQYFAKETEYKRTHTFHGTEYELQKISELWYLKYRKEGVESDWEENQRVLLAAEDTF